MYQCGYCNLIVHDDIQTISQVVRDMKSQCERVVLGIPDDLTFARLYGDLPYSAEEKRNALLSQTIVDDVLILDGKSRYEQVYDQIHFDNVYFGSMFGRAYDRFFSFANQNGIHLSSMMPDRFIPAGQVDALKIALNNLQQHQKIVLFGTGQYFDIFMETYGNRYKPVYAVDNDLEKQGTSKQGMPIYSPEKLKSEDPNNILIVICSQTPDNILQQIRTIGDYDYRLMIYNNTVSLLEEYALARTEELEYLDKAHMILADMLKEFDRVCQKHCLHYYMICGSLIGVIRHKGFIPWDDDVDVAMPRNDYERFKEISKQEWKNKPYRHLGFEEFGNGIFLDCMPRMLYMNDHLPMKVFDKVQGRIPEDLYNRPFIDIYVMDNAFDNEKKHMFNMNMMKAVYNLLMGHRDDIDYEEYKTRIPEKTIRTMKMLHTIGRHLPLSFLAWWYNHLSRKANKKQCENYFMPSCAITCIERKFKQAFFEEGQRKPFLDFKVTVPKDYDGLMEAMGYHGYMQFPRMTIRKPSHYFNSDIVIW